LNNYTIYKQYFIKILSLRQGSGDKIYSVYPFVFNWYFFHYLGRYFSAIVTPIFILFNIKPNFVSIARYFICIASFFLLLGNSDYEIFKTIFLSFLMNYFLLDFVDGDIARVIEKSTFFGRQLDGWIDMHLQACIYLFSGFIIYQMTSNHSYLYISIVVFFMVFIANLNIDRYASFRRWIKEEHGIDIGTHSLNDLFKSLRYLHSDIIIFNLILGCFIINLLSLKVLLLYGLFWNSAYFLYFLFLQFANVGDITDKPKFDGKGKIR